MPRANSSIPRHKRHRKLIKTAKGYYGSRSTNFRTAKDAVIKAFSYAYRDRRVRKRQFRRLWITRINAAVRMHGMTYSRFIAALTSKNVTLNRKVLADLAVNEPQSFEAIVKSVS